MEYVYRSARTITSDRIQDRFLTAQIQKAPEAIQTNMGTLFSLVEILNPWFPTSGHIHSVFEGFFHPEVYDEIVARHGGFKCKQVNIEADGCRTHKWHVIHL